MWAAIASFVATLLEGLLGKSSPTRTDLAASNAVSQTELTQETAAYVETTKAAAARADADARIVQRDPAANAVDTDPRSPVNTDPDAHFRD